MHKLSRNDPCHCGSDKKYKRCHLDADESGARAERQETQRADTALIQRVEIESKPLGQGFWALAAFGVVLAVGVGITKGVSGGLAVAAAWGLGMGAWSVLRDPPPPRADAGDPAGLSFGMSVDQVADETQARVDKALTKRSQVRSRDARG